MSETPRVIVPPMLYLPVVETLDGAQHAVVRDLVDGRTCLLAYTALDRLADKCGENQPWILISTSNLVKVKEEQPFDTIAFDLDVPIDLLSNGRIA
jgi:hypothetical protein